MSNVVFKNCCGLKLKLFRAAAMNCHKDGVNEPFDDQCQFSP